jgi:hypothetical protein
LDKPLQVIYIESQQIGLKKEKVIFVLLSINVTFTFYFLLFVDMSIESKVILIANKEFKKIWRSSLARPTSYPACRYFVSSPYKILFFRLYNSFLVLMLPFQFPYSSSSRPKPLHFLPSSSLVALAWLSGPRSRPTTSRKIWWLREPNVDLWICSQ